MASSNNSTNGQSSRKRPNLLVIIADDLGFSDIGCYGSEIQTPSIDALASEGLRLLNFHTAAACSPTRAMIMSGTDAHLGGLGVLIEYKKSAKGMERWSGKPGYEGFLNREVATIAEILEDQGYFTTLAGKWHLGMRNEDGPWARGFQKSFAMLPGCSNHYAWEPVLEGGDPANFMGGRPVHAENGKRADIKPNKSQDGEDGFYSTDYYTGKLLEYLEGRSEEEKEKPFCGFLTFSAPHWPLQAPKKIRDKYRGMYDDGPIALRSRRLANLVKAGIITPDVVPHEIVAPEVPPWDEYSPHEKECSSRAMEAYAAMVDSIDENVGRVVQYLEETGEYDDTMIVFMSDNGAEGSALEALPVIGEKLLQVIHQHYDNSPENIGNWNSFTWLGPLWAQASTAPSRLYKCFPSEGGILVPCVVKPPRGVFRNEVLGGAMSRAFSTCMDIAPTFLDMLGVTLPKAPADISASTKGAAMSKRVLHRGRAVHPMTGRSWLPYYSSGNLADPRGGEEWAIYPSTVPVGWELFARAALRKGNWKIVHLPKSHGGAAEGDDGWELFDVTADPGETVDLASREPKKLQELLKHWEEYVLEYGIVWGDGAYEPGLPKEDTPDFWRDDMADQKAWMQALPSSVPVFAV